MGDQVRQHRQHIVVGVDGSSSAAKAVIWAAKEADLRGVGLRLVHGYFPPRVAYPGFLATSRELEQGLQEQGQRWINEAVRVAANTASGTAIDTTVVESDPVSLLIDESAKASLTVLGSRGLGGFTGMLVGRTAVALAAHGRSPLAIIRGSATDKTQARGPIIVGTDSSSASEAAIAYAFAEASLRGASLHVIHTWNDAVVDSVAHPGPLSIDPKEIDNEEELLLVEQLAGWQEKYPEVPVTRKVLRGRPSRRLLEYAEQAQMIVVGSRGRGGFKGMLLGSTSHALITHAPCPVIVVGPGTHH